MPAWRRDCAPCSRPPPASGAHGRPPLDPTASEFLDYPARLVGADPPRRPGLRIRGPMPELRKDPVVGRWVIISTERSRRPSNFAPATRGKAEGFCPFCPGNEDKTPPAVYTVKPPATAAAGPGWRVRVVPNKFPALQIEGGLDRRGEGLYDRMNGVGAHEVVIESPDHEKDLADLPV